MNVNRLEQTDCKLATTPLRTDRRAADNSGFKKLAVQWLIEHSSSHKHLWWLDSFVLRNRPRWRGFVIRDATNNPPLMYFLKQKIRPISEPDFIYIL